MEPKPETLTETAHFLSNGRAGLQLANEAAYRSFAVFFRQAWPEIEPGTPLVWNWHLDIICNALQKQIEGDPNYRKLLLCVPPGSSKSIAVSVMAPAWEWLRQPHRRKLNFTNDGELASRDSRRMRELLLSSWYQQLIVHAYKHYKVPVWLLADDQNEKVNFQNTVGGFRQSRSVTAKVTGKRGDDIVIDDPLDAKQTIGSVEQINKRLQFVNDVIDKTLPSRVNRVDRARWTMIMQRLHPQDPAGMVIKNESDSWAIVNIQMEFDPDNPLNHPDDPRKEKGELMCPELFPAHEVERLKFKLGTDYWAQYQQDPRPGERSVLKKEYWRFWYPADVKVPEPVKVRLPNGDVHQCPQVCIPRVLKSLTQSWDMAFKDTKDSAYVVGQVWAQESANHYLLDQLREKLDIVGTVQALRMLSKKWPAAIEKLVEDKANGPGVIAMLQNEVVGLIPVNPEGGKEARMNAIAPACKSGNVYLPHPDVFPWVRDFIDECASAPVGSYMDQVDAFTQYMNSRIGGHGAALAALLGA